MTEPEENIKMSVASLRLENEGLLKINVGEEVFDEVPDFYNLIASLINPAIFIPFQQHLIDTENFNPEEKSNYYLYFFDKPVASSSGPQIRDADNSVIESSVMIGFHIANSSTPKAYHSILALVIADDRTVVKFYTTEFKKYDKFIGLIKQELRDAMEEEQNE